MTLQEYLAAVPPERKDKFESLTKLVRSLYPKAVESMKYKMPTYEFDEGWVAVANQKSYISLYTCSEQHISSFKKKHPAIKTGKGCINFKDKDDIPLADLKAVVKSAMETPH